MLTTSLAVNFKNDKMSKNRDLLQNPKLDNAIK